VSNKINNILLVKLRMIWKLKSKLLWFTGLEVICMGEILRKTSAWN